MVLENGLSVYQAATILNLKNSAAKTLLRKHYHTRTAPAGHTKILILYKLAAK